ncbi:MAG: hypothetical protein JNM59_07225 [Hyphomonadaceae bacterium]|nr:hypothetical protein [Hyphomonadaceae bacterium]
MPNAPRPAVGSEDWMFEQQLRAELEAEAWRRLRRELAPPVAPQIPLEEPPAPLPAPRKTLDYHAAGSSVLKGIVRVGLAGFGAYLAWLAAFDAQLGEFETWLAGAAGFLATLSFSLFGPARRLVHTLAEALRWTILGGAAVGVVWLLLQAQS